MRYPQSQLVCRRPVLLAFLTLIAYSLFSFFLLQRSASTLLDVVVGSSSRLATAASKVKGPCAINLYGLPRSFQSLVLPSLVQNVLIPNAVYHCDYYIHYHDLKQDKAVRDGRGGQVNPDEIRLLEAKVKEVAQNIVGYQPKVVFDMDTEQEFWTQHGNLLHRIQTARDSDGNFLYMPYSHKSYSNATVENVIKMWHSQTRVWNLMERTSSTKHYSRVAMLRSDVVYVNPIDIYQLPNHKLDYANEVAVIPNFARHPVNDRLMYGPYDAVRIWASQRFERLQQHAQLVHEQHAGDGIHSERFLDYTIFPAIWDAGIEVDRHADLCFLRARADESIRFADCGIWHVTEHNKQAVEYLIGRRCQQNMAEAHRDLVSLECRSGSTTDEKLEPLTWKNMPK